MEQIKLENLNIKDIVKIEALKNSVVITLYNGDYISYNKKLDDVLKELLKGK
jgi:hypothetical protein